MGQLLCNLAIQRNRSRLRLQDSAVCVQLHIVRVGDEIIVRLALLKPFLFDGSLHRNGDCALCIRSVQTLIYMVLILVEGEYGFFIIIVRRATFIVNRSGHIDRGLFDSFPPKPICTLNIGIIVCDNRLGQSALGHSKTDVPGDFLICEVNPCHALSQLYFFFSIGRHLAAAVRCLSSVGGRSIVYRGFGNQVRIIHLCRISNDILVNITGIFIRDLISPSVVILIF